jgi:amino acid transporter
MGLSSKGLKEGIVASPSDDDMTLKPTSGQIDGLTNSDTHRGLSSRHVQFLALGGCIGTLLFVGSGLSLSTVGPDKLIWIYFRINRTCSELRHRAARLIERL